eukprot:8216340-Alexandrium_andersonii.AAC.1
MAPKSSKGSSSGAASSGGPSKKPSALDLISEDQGKLGHKGAQAVRDRLLALKKAGNSTPFDTYSALSSGTDKLSFALKLKLDPDGAFCQVEETSSVSASNRMSK